MALVAASARERPLDAPMMDLEVGDGQPPSVVHRCHTLDPLPQWLS
jgi:hypothetical protein